MYLSFFPSFFLCNRNNNFICVLFKRYKVLFYQSGASEITTSFHFCSIRAVQGFVLLERCKVLFYQSGARFCSIRAVQGFVLLERCKVLFTALKVRSRDVQISLGRKCGAKKCGGRCKKWRQRVGKKTLPEIMRFFEQSDQTLQNELKPSNKNN